MNKEVVSQALLPAKEQLELAPNTKHQLSYMDRVALGGCGIAAFVLSNALIVPDLIKSWDAANLVLMDLGFEVTSVSIASAALCTAVKGRLPFAKSKEKSSIA